MQREQKVIVLKTMYCCNVLCEDKRLWNWVSDARKHHSKVVISQNFPCRAGRGKPPPPPSPSPALSLRRRRSSHFLGWIGGLKSPSHSSTLAGPSGNMVENIWSLSSYLNWYEETSWLQQNDKTYFHSVSSICMMSIGMQIILNLGITTFFSQVHSVRAYWKLEWDNKVLIFNITNDMKRFQDQNSIGRFTFSVFHSFAWHRLEDN